MLILTNLSFSQRHQIHKLMAKNTPTFSWFSAINTRWECSSFKWAFARDQPCISKRFWKVWESRFLVFRDWNGITLDVRIEVVRFKVDFTEVDFCLREISLGESLSNFSRSPFYSSIINLKVLIRLYCRANGDGERTLTRYLPNFFMFISTF